jgi:hypothetical protein
MYGTKDPTCFKPSSSKPVLPTASPCIAATPRCFVKASDRRDFKGPSARALGLRELKGVKPPKIPRLPKGDRDKRLDAAQVR